jgi:hypothetical protein
MHGRNAMSEAEVKSETRDAWNREPEVREPPIPGELMGLCRHCSERFVCEIARPEGGVWHCPRFF